MTLALTGTRRDAGVSVAEVNLKLIWDVVSQIKVGERGQAYLVDAQGRLIAHPDISLVLRNTDLSRLAQVQAARAAGSGSGSDATEQLQEADDIQGRRVLTAYAHVAPLGWLVFVELPRGRGLCSALLDHQALRHSAAGGAGLRLRRRAGARAQDGRPDSGVARRRRAHRQRRPHPAHHGQDRRRAGGARGPIQRHGGEAAGILRRPGEKGRAAHPRARAIGRRSCARSARSARRSTPRSISRRCSIPSSAKPYSSPTPMPARSTNTTMPRSEFELRSTYGMDEALIAAIKERHIRIGDAGIGHAAASTRAVADCRRAEGTGHRSPAMSSCAPATARC